MIMLRLILIALLFGTVSVSSQTVPAGAPVQPTQLYGSVLIQGKLVKDKGKQSVARKRFYLFNGGMKENAALIERIKSAEIISRDCYYTQVGASPCFIDWLGEGVCETPFCRKIDKDDVARVKEFQAAYTKGLPLYGRKPDIALDWLVNNLPPNLASGFYRQQRNSINQILKGQRPVESTISTAEAAEAAFVNIPVGDKPGTYLVSNILPIEVGNKSFVWICEVSVSGNKEARIVLSGDPNKKIKGCEVSVKDLKTCSAGTCDKTVATSLIGSPATPAPAAVSEMRATGRATRTRSRRAVRR